MYKIVCEEPISSVVAQKTLKGLRMFIVETSLPARKRVCYVTECNYLVTHILETGFSKEAYRRRGTFMVHIS